MVKDTRKGEPSRIFAAQRRSGTKSEEGGKETAGHGRFSPRHLRGWLSGVDNKTRRSVASRGDAFPAISKNVGDDISELSGDYFTLSL